MKKDVKKSVMRRIGVTMLWILAAVVVLGLINFAPMLGLKTPGMRKYEVEGISVYAKPKDEADVVRIAGSISRSRDKVIDAFRDVDAEGIDVILYPNRGALKRKTIGLIGYILLPQWYIGKNTSDRVLIISPAEPGPEHTRESVEQAAVHEYVHVLTDRQYKTMGYWLKEGFALYLAEQKPEISDVRNQRDITYKEFSAPNALQFAEVGGYALAYKMMEYLDQEYGWDKVLDFLIPGTSFEDITGVPEKEFFKDWKTWLQAI